MFFCAQAVPASAADGPSLPRVRLAWGLARFTPVDYQTAQFGRFDPVLLAQARKRIVAAKETWSACPAATPARSRAWPTSSSW